MHPSASIKFSGFVQVHHPNHPGLHSQVCIPQCALPLLPHPRILQSRPLLLRPQWRPLPWQLEYADLQISRHLQGSYNQTHIHQLQLALQTLPVHPRPGQLSRLIHPHHEIVQNGKQHEQQLFCRGSQPQPSEQWIFVRVEGRP